MKMIEMNEIKHILSDVIDEDDFLIAIYIFSLCLYEPDIDYKQLTMQFKESLMKGYENEY